jgi:hypothetical protein
MSNSSLACGQTILSTKVDGSRRPLILPHYFPSTFLLMENAVYGFADKLCKDYLGAFWDFYELSNGGFYMAPNLKGLMAIEVPFGNSYRGTMSANALGIIACLYAYSALAEQHPESNYGDFYWHLRDFAGNHAEASAIFSAID